MLIASAGGFNVNDPFVAVGPDHSVYTFWYANNPLTLQMRKSTNQGVSFGAPVTVATILSTGVNGDLNLTGIRQGTATPANFRTNSYPHAAVNPISGHIYVTFNDNPVGADKGDIYMVMSTDGGASWDAPVRVNDDATTTDQWQPTMAVTPTGDRLGIFYYSRQEDPAGNNQFSYYSRFASISGSSVTFAPSSPVSDTPSLPEFGRDTSVNSVYMGDYDTAVATGGFFHVVWSDSRSDLPGGAPRKDPNVYYDKLADGSTGIAESGAPLATRLGPAVPNPFRDTTTLSFDQAEDGDITLHVYGPNGALVGTLARGHRSAGRHRVVWDAEDSSGRPLPAGVYFVSLTAGERTWQLKAIKLP